MRMLSAVLNKSNPFFVKSISESFDSDENIISCITFYSHMTDMSIEVTFTLMLINEIDESIYKQIKNLSNYLDVGDYFKFYLINENKLLFYSKLLFCSRIFGIIGLIELCEINDLCKHEIHNYTKYCHTKYYDTYCIRLIDIALATKADLLEYVI